jgi:hypothetical protein
VPTVIDILWLAGTGFGNTVDGVSDEFWRHLRDRCPDRFRFVTVTYPAAYGIRLSYGESLDQGRTALLQAIEDSPNKVIIGGYSQGAEIAGNVAAEVSGGEHPFLAVLGCVLIADPRRPTGTSADPVTMGVASGYGIRGMRLIDLWKVPTLWCANEGDAITSLPEGNPLRSIADITEFFAATLDADRANVLYTKVLNSVIEGRMQRWWSWKNWRTWGGALAYTRGYIRDGRHNTDYIRNGLCDRLAGAVARQPWGD